jgi:8-oxo-dGTP pyrophosphatase MutT (NUDIX family)
MAPFIPEPSSVEDILRRVVPREQHRAGYARAAVLIPLLWRGADYDVILTRRTDDVETHKGQVSFPGGVRDATDATAVETALREAEEELGLPRSAVRIAGMLDDMVIPTGFVVRPVVGMLQELPALVPNPAEVVEVFRVPLSFFAFEGNGRREERTVNGTSYDVWHYTAGGHLIWGATAAMIRVLLGTIGVIPPQAPRPPA